ncbi:hypothetical protein BOTNAR_0172g00270 [Botryotinia narcissicola]|uniref:Uncharacterized protein n=1 Tax=Botryotinia narcissicola TaxID=278944 RepID=A0A4Z1IBE8_9HELO|nr:hypothetical protein BOTNAR_0172g00270 [Botryotinia narcissicola]
MADVRSLLKNERVARRIQHKHAGYSTAGNLMCLVCNLQMKSESLWEGHLRSPGHILRLSKQQEAERERNATAGTNSNEGTSKKRKLDDEDEDMDMNYGTLKKRSKATPTALEGFFSPPPNKQANVDEDEWAAFEADIAAAEVPTEVESEAVIFAPAMTTAEVEARTAEEEKARRKEKLEAEVEGDREDASRKLQEEFEEMESLDQRVKRLREKREALWLKEKDVIATVSIPTEEPAANDVSEDDDDYDDDEDDWDGFRLR